MVITIYINMVNYIVSWLNLWEQFQLVIHYVTKTIPQKQLEEQANLSYTQIHNFNRLEWQVITN